MSEASPAPAPSGPRHVLGLSAFYHDSAAALVRDGEIVAAAQEERFSRRKGDARFPREAAAYCLAEAGIEARELEAVAYYDKPIQTFGRLLQSYLEYPLRSWPSFKTSLPLWLEQKLHIPREIDERLSGFCGEIYFCRHHESHAASSFFCSPFEEAALLIVDGVGEWACTSIGAGRDGAVRMLQEVRFPHSIGLFYSALTQYLGFAVDRDEYKVMGLAPYGRPLHRETLLEHVIDLKPDGSIALDLRYFDYTHGLRMIHPRLGALLGQPAREPEAPLTEFHMDVAASVQAITTEAMLRLARTARRLTGLPRLCLAGGVALNCVANGAILRDGSFDELYVQPAAGDAGGAVGAALQAWHQALGAPRTARGDRMQGGYLGPDATPAEAQRTLQALGASYELAAEDTLPGRIAGWIAAGHVVAVCRGRMEFGPRALGARSILADPRAADAQSRINRKVKYRESFRPFAPAILEERVAEFFEADVASPYMLLVLPLRAEQRLHQEENAAKEGFDKLRVVRSSVPAVTHVDYTARLQTLTAERNPFLHEVVRAFDTLTGCPMVVNTSFNVRDEPIVGNAEDAYRCFLMTDIDVLVVGDCVVAKPGTDLDAPPRAAGAAS